MKYHQFEWKQIRIAFWPEFIGSFEHAVSQCLENKYFKMRTFLYPPWSLLAFQWCKNNRSGDGSNMPPVLLKLGRFSLFATREVPRKKEQLMSSNGLTQKIYGLYVKKFAGSICWFPQTHNSSGRTSMLKFAIFMSRAISAVLCENRRFWDILGATARKQGEIKSRTVSPSSTVILGKHIYEFWWPEIILFNSWFFAEVVTNQGLEKCLLSSTSLFIWIIQK